MNIDIHNKKNSREKRGNGDDRNSFSAQENRENREIKDIKKEKDVRQSEKV